MTKTVLVTGATAGFGEPPPGGSPKAGWNASSPAAAPTAWKR